MMTWTRNAWAELLAIYTKFPHLIRYIFKRGEISCLWNTLTRWICNRDRNQISYSYFNRKSTYFIEVGKFHVWSNQLTWNVPIWSAMYIVRITFRNGEFHVGFLNRYGIWHQISLMLSGNAVKPRLVTLYRLVCTYGGISCQIPDIYIIDGIRHEISPQLGVRSLDGEISCPMPAII